MKNNTTAANDLAKQEYEIKVWYYESTDDEAMGIMTMRYENGSIVKRTTLKDGRVAICRQLRGVDRHIVNRVSGGDPKKQADAVTALSTKIDDKDIVIEDLDLLLYSDVQKIAVMSAMLNFM